MRLNIPAPSYPRVFFSLPYSTSAANIGPNPGIRRHWIAAESGLAADIIRARVIVREETDSKGSTTVRSARVERLPRQDVSCWKKSIPFQYFFFFLPFFSSCVCLSRLITQTDGDRHPNINRKHSRFILGRDMTSTDNRVGEQIGFVSAGGTLEVGAPRAKAMQMKPAVYLHRSGNTID